MSLSIALEKEAQPQNRQDEPDTGDHPKAPLHAARRGLLKAVWEASFAPRFSSRPIDMEDYFSRESFGSSNHGSTILSSFALDETERGNEHDSMNQSSRHSLADSKNLTKFEQSFLEGLLQSEDLDSIRKASERLADKDLFPSTQVDEGPAGGVSASRRALERRQSAVQQELFRLHQSTTVKPSIVLKRMSTQEKQEQGKKSRAKMATASTPLMPPLQHSNSILTANSNGEGSKSPTFFTRKKVDGEEGNKGESWDMNSEEGKIAEQRKDIVSQPRPRRPPRPERVNTAWNPFGDVNSWIDGNQGVEVDGEGIPNLPSPTSNPFKILGTSADDVSAHPHVLTPPLMEGLQEFMPESLHEYHFWLKFSLVRDGYSNSSDALIDMLRQCRGSTYTVLAIETTEGYVFGAFCSQPWRRRGDKYFGTKDAFVWRMRRSRNEPCESIVEQVLLESQIDIFPFAGQNAQVQRCSEEGLVMGEGEVEELSEEGEHYGHAIRLAPSMEEAWTSTCETFRSPCLVPTDRRGEHVDIANVELWALTPHTSVESAITAEMKELFLSENRGPTEKNLDLLEILVGGPV
mmetsp:Transcript_133991/g.387804  ORF Transcript_133991/g.387804 Transcript_133991/m.387804 type:complete len:576 (-) Transcript_133991:704-2431(-)